MVFYSARWSVEIETVVLHSYIYIYIIQEMFSLILTSPRMDGICRRFLSWYLLVRSAKTSYSIDDEWLEHEVNRARSLLSPRHRWRHRHPDNSEKPVRLQLIGQKVHQALVTTFSPLGYYNP